MSGDPRVLAGLQQAYLAQPQAHEFFLMHIRNAWRTAAERPCVPSHLIDAEIRAWTPPAAEPSLEQRVEDVASQTLNHSNWITHLRNEVKSLNVRLNAIPEPTAPDDPVCARESCGHLKSRHNLLGGNCGTFQCGCLSFLPAPQPAPDLDPVRVEAAAKAVYATRGWGPLEEANYAVQRMWTDDAAIAIKHYLKDGGA